MVRRITYQNGSNCYIIVEANDENEVIVQTSMEEWGIQETHVMACLAEILRCVVLGINLDTHFNPTAESSRDEEIIKCQWTRHHKLKIVDENPPGKFRHAYTINEALQRNRNFTCTRRLYRQIPKIRACT